VPIFDRYVAVDWSANNEPKSGRDSIWSAEAWRVETGLRTANHPTRSEAEAWLLDMLTAAVGEGERVLVGLDFPYGYPRGFAGTLGDRGEPWGRVWEFLDRQIHDDERNVSNRFAVGAEVNASLGRYRPFWGRPAGQLLPDLPAKKQVTYLGEQDAGGLPEWRRVEMCLRDSGTPPQSVWKLAYPGSVGSQSLVGIPVLNRLRNHGGLRDVSRVWPFEVAVPSLPVGAPAVIHAEIWPSIVPFDSQPGSCRDEQQVRAVVETWRGLDRADRLAEWFDTPEDDRVRTEEGWVLGVPAALPRGGPRTTRRARRATGTSDSSARARAVQAAARQHRAPCLCGCGHYPRGTSSRFLPGHDQRRNPATGRPFNAR
jgi:precorrin-8X/cobalt-precorrin-8 methylmutase